MNMREKADEASREPGFWPNYIEPSKLATAIQMPLHDPHWQNRVLNAYARTKPAQAARDGA